MKFNRAIGRDQLALAVKRQHDERARIGVGLSDQLLQYDLANYSIRPCQQCHV
jgi:hypothetical protein